MPDYEYYLTQFLGEDIPQDAFDRYAARARRRLLRYQSLYDLRPRSGLTDHEACAVCAMAEALYAFDAEDARRGIASVSVGSVSESYPAPPELCSETVRSRDEFLRGQAADYFTFGRWLNRGADDEA